MHRYRFALLALVAIVVPLAGCGSSGDGGKDATRDKPTEPATVAASDDTTAPKQDAPKKPETPQVEPKPEQDPNPPADESSVDPNSNPRAEPVAADGSSQGVDTELPDYQPVQGISGNFKSVGSDTMNNLMANWSEGFRKHYPNVREEIEGKGSSTAMPALIAGTATFGPMSRAAKPDEIDKFEQKFGYKPTQLGTSIDMLAVFVNRDNPIKGLSLDQCDAIFSQTRKRGATNDITKWGQLGLSGAYADQPISLYGRNSASGTYGFFKEVALGDGDYKSSVKEQPGSSAVVQAIGKEKYAIGYSGIGYKTEDVRALPLTLKAGDEDFVAPDARNADDYPLSRFLYLTVNYRPNAELSPLQREFVRYVFSRQGQEDVLKDGYVPLPAAIAKQQLARVGIE